MDAIREILAIIDDFSKSYKPSQKKIQNAPIHADPCTLDPDTHPSNSSIYVHESTFQLVVTTK